MLLLKRRVVGRKTHRSGWPWAVQALRRVASGAGVILDDFVEATFSPRPSSRPHSSAWVGVFHSPVRVSSPLPSDRSAEVRRLERHRHWLESKRHLIGAVALCDELGDYLPGWLKVPVKTLLHPTETDVRPWSAERCLSSPRLVQIGATLRNTRVIHDVDPPGWRRCRIGMSTVLYRRRYGRLRRLGGPSPGGDAGVEELPYQSFEAYDEVLASSVVVAEYFGAAASNTVVECMARGTPLVANRLPALAEYLGDDYPLFYERACEIPSLLARQRLLAASEHLRRRAAMLPTFEGFAESVKRFVDRCGGGGGFPS